MHTIKLEYHDHVAVARLEHGKANAVNSALLEQLSEILEQTKNDPEVHSLLLTSGTPKFFSIGFDLPALIELTKDDFRDFIQVFDRVCLDLYTMPKPAIAAITGHATGGGCILAVCCDYRFIAEGRTLMGINAIKIGVPIPSPSICMLIDLLGSRNARTLVDSGKFYAPEEALGMGLVDHLLPPDEVVPRALELAQALGSWSQQAYALNKRNRTVPVQRKIMAELEAQEQAFVECWYSTEAQQRMREALVKF